MTKRNPNLKALKANYLFPEVNLRKKQFLSMNPEAQLISLGIGDTTEPLTPYIDNALIDASAKLGTKEGYVGYGPEQGIKLLREKIASRLYNNKVSPDDIFISDGTKCDIGRLQMLFGGDISVAIQDPAYPVYVDGSLIAGVNEIVMMPCSPENGFFPDLSKTKATDILYFCSPNNPTGEAATKDQLRRLVDFAKQNKSIILYDSAYAHYIQDPKLPRSIFEIDGAHEVAIELGSFSKIAGFTGVRLGWTVVPESLKYNDGYSVRADWNRLMATIFNGASSISQLGGCAVLDDQGLKEIDDLAKYYMENTQIIKKSLANSTCEIYGGLNAPYLWLNFPKKKSWDIFQYCLEKLHLVVTPGIGFGGQGEGFIRLAAFGHRENILEAAKRLSKGITPVL